MMRIWVAALVGAWAMPAAAQQVTANDALSGADAANRRAGDRLGTLSGAATFGLIDEDFYVTLSLRLAIDQDGWGLGLGLPLRLRVYDADPKDPTGVVIRKEDWDEVSDFFKVIRYVYLGSPDRTGPYYLRLGELSGVSLGHGTIVNRFYNGFDMDRFRLGGDFYVRVGPYSGEVLIGDMARPQDTVVTGVRFTVRPLILGAYHSGEAAAAADPDAPPVAANDPDPAVGATRPAAAEPPSPIDPDSLAARLVTGLSLVTDPTAPRSLRCQPRPGVDVAQAGSGCDPAFYTVDLDDNHPVSRNDEVLAVLGIDVAYELLRGAPLSITPYIDLNNVLNVENGWGFHIGVLWALRVPALIDTLTVDLRTEYRRVSGDYVSPYFDSTYVVERYESPAGSGMTKLQGLRQPYQLADGTIVDPRQAPGKNGVFFDLLAGFPNFVYIGGEFIDYDGGANDGTLRLSLQIPALEFIQLNAFYLRTRISGLDDLFALDDRSAIVGEVAIPFYSVLSLQARWWRLWRANADGNFTSVDDWSVGVGFNLEL